MQVGAYNTLPQRAAIQKQRALTRPQPLKRTSESQRSDASRKTKHSAVLQGEYLQKSNRSETFEHLKGIGLSVRNALDTYAETASFQPHSLRGELVGVDLYV